MRGLSSFGIFFAIVGLACGRELPRAPSGASASGPQVTATPAPAQSKAFDSDTVGCAAVPKVQFRAPELLVNEWVHRDTLGYFLGADARLFELMACPGHLGGGDEIVVAIDPTVQRLPSVGDSAVFLITYQRFGTVYSDTSGARQLFTPAAGIDSVRVTAVNTIYGWRFPYDVANPHLSPRVTLREYHGEWVPSSRDSLTALAARLVAP